MEIVQSRVVHARGARWTVVNVRAFDRCRLLTLAGVGVANKGVERRLLTPFDSIEPVRRRDALSRVSWCEWRRDFRMLLAADRPPGCLVGLDETPLNPYPHQLEPALAVVRGLGSRLLLADEVGLGKTIEAGVVIAELRARGAADRVLVITPAGLRDQWCHELAVRLGLDALVVDVAASKRARAARAVGVSVWQTTPVAVTSVDYIKRTEVLAAVAACRWDVVVVDEAHGVAGDSDRRAAVGALAARAGVVLLLTATPHSGDRRAFASLCGMGAVNGDRLLVFRRARAEVGTGVRRRVHRLDVRPSAAERLMHRELSAFAQRIRREHSRHPDVLVGLSVIQKRAYSSPRALELTVSRRLAALDEQPDAGPRQIDLPLDETGESTMEDAAPEWPASLALDNINDERGLLVRLRDAARAATAAETKLHAVGRLIARVRQPVLVFTEYRDTLLHLQKSLACASAVLHGGLPRSARRAALESFGRNDVQVLLATDAAGEGLNLQASCAVVVNLELPWTPTRLEQRIGRVDRIGQRHTVHVFHLVARDTESRLWSHLAARVGQAQADVGGPNPLRDGDTGQRAAGGPDEEAASLQSPPAELADQARVETARIMSRRSWRRESTRSDSDATGHHIVSTLERRGPLLADARSWRTRAALGARAITLWRTTAIGADGRLVGSRLVPVAVPMPSTCVERADIDAHLAALRHGIHEAIDAATRAWRDEVLAGCRAWSQERALRREGVRARQDRAIPSGIQRGLFDRREERAALAMLAAEGARSRSEAPLQHLDTAPDAIAFHEPELLLVLVP